ncbi:flagellar biosynthesis anti-sigma factor FlgM [Castellaniella sp.]|uniref:flagellar biosynthesis anti-sigma factor FlgM n=1 Tax=Castellaniella sp. TaxID=1955812 RepID=UPI002AFEB818|nr:flagellar biosynthesis anti-sigma factor FlgM [Castellaniella sp.]
MKINSSSSSTLIKGVSGNSRHDNSPASISGSAKNRADVDLSPAARQLAALNDNSADIRAERVQQIRDALASGELQIDAGRIADSLLASVRDLLK